MDSRKSESSADMSLSLAQDGHEYARRGQLQLLALFAVAFVPMLLAMSMYFFDWRLNGRQVNNGTLIESTLRLDKPLSADMGDAVRLTDQPFDGNTLPSGLWRLVITAPMDCDQSCQQHLYITRQINVALGREADRVQRDLWIADRNDVSAKELAVDYPELNIYQLRHADWQLLEQKAGLSQVQLPGRVWIIDPMGNVVMQYDQAKVGKPLLKDLQRLMKLSKIG